MSDYIFAGASGSPFQPIIASFSQPLLLFLLWLDIRNLNPSVAALPSCASDRARNPRPFGARRFPPKRFILPEETNYRVTRLNRIPPSPSPLPPPDMHGKKQRNPTLFLFMMQQPSRVRWRERGKGTHGRGTVPPETALALFVCVSLLSVEHACTRNLL
jgi:hypothetical protein